MNKECIEIIKTKSFEELSGEELNLLSEWCAGKEEFEGLKLVFTGVDILREEDQSQAMEKVKTSLDSLFEEKHRKSGIRKLYPLLMVAAMTLFVIVTYVFWNKKETTYVTREKQDALKKEIPVEEKNINNTDAQENNLQENVLLAENNSEKSAFEPKEEAGPVRVQEYTTSDVEEMIVVSKSEESNYFSSIPQSQTSNVLMPATQAEEPVFNHPDGIYTGSKKVKKSVSLNEQKNILDLITPSF